MKEVKLWALEKDQNKNLVPVPVDTLDHTETEKQLEELLVRTPEILMPGLTLVGRQTPIEGGALDLLGVDEDGNLVVSELKRGTLSRDAVAQIIDYASFLASLDSESLSEHVSQRSGTGVVFGDVHKIIKFIISNLNGKEANPIGLAPLIFYGAHGRI